MVMLGNFFEKRRQKNILGKYVSKNVANAIIDGKSLPDLRIQAGKIEFVLVFVRGDSAEQNSERIALVSDWAMKSKWVVENVVSSLVILTSGMIPNGKNPASRLNLINELRQQLNSNVKIIHGAGEGYFGLFGSSTLCRYTFLVPKFDLALARLGQIEFGKIEEFVF